METTVVVGSAAGGAQPASTEHNKPISNDRIPVRFLLGTLNIHSLFKKTPFLDGWGIVRLYSRRRGVAQLASALRLGRRGRRFKSAHPDSFD